MSRYKKDTNRGAIIGPLVAGGASRQPGIAIAAETIPS